MHTFKNTLYILFGSRTGNSKSVAVLAHEYAKSLGYASELKDMQEMDFQDLQQIEHLLLIVSTHGEGEPPVQAESFYSFIHSSDMKELNCRYAVLGLGDSSYRYFCQTGEDIDKRLSELGGQRVMSHVKCDIDFEETAKSWVLDVFDTLKGELSPVHPPQKEGFVFDLKLGNDTNSAYKAELLSKTLLTAENSSKKVLHVSLSLKNSGLDYEPGDALGVYGVNSRSLVDRLLGALGFDKAYPVQVKEQTRLLKELLIHDYELTMLTPLVVRNYAEIVNNPVLNKLITNSAQLEAYTAERDVLDLVSDYPGNISVEQLLGVLRKLSQRLYSVASSRLVAGEKADITVKIIENQHNQRVHEGVCSSYLWNRLDVGDRVPVSLETIAKFRLPEDDNTPIIMVAAGTGIAPFRGFLQERSARQAKGKNWLFFGERNSKSDYLYKEDLAEFVNTGILTRLNTAFSRDQEEKVYVSHLLEQQAKELMDWLNNGAIIYVCGSKDKLAVSVRNSLIKLFGTCLQLNEEQATRYLDELKSKRLYQEEVY
ncbi:diflavin oxidoreductase [Carboxylicivirga taeanensis]|uniref:diflavin oxidoreductase n=1 Tax=Carboxylicivirga taeanensis TaxID=1416875 RepID=UPI003F6E2A80